MTDQDNRYGSLDQIVVRAARGMVTSVGGVCTTFCFDGGDAPDRRRASLDVLEDFAQSHTGTLDEWHPPGERSRADIGDTDIWDAYRRAADSTPPDAGGGAIVQVGPKDRKAPVPCYGELSWARRSNWPSQLVLAEPGGILDHIGLDAWVARVLGWCDTLKPTHGTAGLALLPHPGHDARSFAVDAWPLLARYPGFDWPDTIPFSVATKKEPKRYIRTSNWLTILDDAFVEALGGRSAVDSALSAACTVLEWDGGILIRAGDEPQLGDINQGIIPEAYGDVARLVAPLRFNDYSDRMPLFFPAPPASASAESRKWLARFN